MTLSRRTASGLLLAIFLVAFFLRAYRPQSRPNQWLDRAEAFTSALRSRDLDGTYRSRHPGFTVMVVSGLTLQLYQAVQDTPARVLFTWAIHPTATDFGARMTVGVLGLALVLSALIVAVALALRRLGGWALALASAGLLTFAPFILSLSQSLHVDALVSSLMLFSALLLLLNLQTGRRGYLLASGLVGGFALLTKTPALFLVPFTGLALLVHLVGKLRGEWADHTEGRGRWMLRTAWKAAILPGLLWVVMLVIPFLLWPAMWVKPYDVLDSMFQGTKEHVVDAHRNPRFFAGRIYTHTTPSKFFYPVTFAFNETFLTLPLVVVALGHYTLWRKRVRPPLPPTVFWLLFAYPAFFAIQMTLGAKRTERYILPVHMPVVILAAVGLVGLIDLVQKALAQRGKRVPEALPAVLVGLTVGLQALVTLPLAPDYGAHHNYLLGGNRAAVGMIEVLGENEGIRHVTNYLNGQPDPEATQVGVTQPLKVSVEQYFAGGIENSLLPDTEYYIFSLTALQRHLRIDEWESAWEAVQGQPPELVVSYDGVEHLWLYAMKPTPATETVRIRRGWIGFVGVAWAWTLALLVTLVWALRRVSPMSEPAEGRQP
jgi:4-amino-4-deoxy-L-arabinose transferase-like glycosyltransferase